jgi:transcriptional regulator with XRE-family HTH domain
MPTTVEHRLMVGRNIRKHRERAKGRSRPLTQADLADEMWAAGLRWTPAVVKIAENGQRSISATELVALSLILEVPIADLLDPGDETDEIFLGPDEQYPHPRKWAAGYWRRAIRGELPEGTWADFLSSTTTGRETGRPLTPEEVEQENAAIAKRLREVQEARVVEIAERWRLDPVHVLGRWVAHPLLAHSRLCEHAERVCRRVGIPTSALSIEEIHTIGLWLWAQPFPVEFEERVAERVARLEAKSGQPLVPRSIQAVRAQVARELDAEVAAHVLSVAERSNAHKSEPT